MPRGVRTLRGSRRSILKLAGVEPDALAFCFDAVTRGSVAEDARLEMITLPGSAWCARCEATVELNDPLAPCPRCGDYSLRITGGSEMRVKGLEVE